VACTFPHDGAQQWAQRSASLVLECVNQVSQRSVEVPPAAHHIITTGGADCAGERRIEGAGAAHAARREDSADDRV
jgi:hypothetical protein